MTQTTVDQTRRDIILADGRPAYEITTRVVDAGELPTQSLFVVKINEPLNPKADALGRIAQPMDLRRLQGSALYVRVDAADLIYIASDPFARVTNLSDLTSLVQDRAEAVRRGAAEYLTDVVTMVYTDSATADAAYRQLLSRLSALVVSWRAFASGFVTNPAQRYLLPAVDASVEAERIAAYNAARSQRLRAEAALTEAQTSYDECDTGCALNRAVHALLVSDVAFLEQAERLVVGLGETNNTQDFVLGRGSYVTSSVNYAAMLVAKRTALETYANLLRGCAETCAQRRTVRDEAQAEVARALADEQRAVAAVRAVCPTFVPTE